MRFHGERHIGAPVEEVWNALHDREVLREVVTGCASMEARGSGVFSAVLAARIGPVSDTYRGTFTILDLRPGTALQVRVEARGRCGRLRVDLRVSLAGGGRATVLRYDADATVSGLVARLGTPTLTVAGGHFTGCFFRNLDRAMRQRLAPASARPS